MKDTIKFVTKLAILTAAALTFEYLNK